MKNDLIDFITENKNEDQIDDKTLLNEKEIGKVKEKKEYSEFNLEEITDINNFYKNEELNKKATSKNIDNDILSKLNTMNMMNTSFDSIKQQGNLAYFDFTKQEDIILNENKKIENKSDISKPKSSSSLKAKLSSKEEFKSNKYFDESFRETEKINKSEDFNLNDKMMKLYRLNSNKKSEESESGILVLYFSVVISVFLMLVFLFFYIHFGNYTNEILLETRDFILSMNDERDYKAVKLSNGIEALLISDSKISKSTASLSVGVGSLQDPEKIPGLSHLLEHIIFSGSISFPKRNYFEDFLNINNGISNAFTDDLKTTFYFESNSDNFKKALLIFSKMLLEPLITDTSIENEINNIEAEFYKNIENDSWREHQLIKNLANPKHPYNWFGIGNKSVFKSIPIQDLKKMLVTHFSEYYQPFNMKLTIVSNHDISIMEDLVTDYFSFIKETKKPKQQYSIIKSSERVYNEKDLGKIVWFNKIQGKPTLDFIFTFIEKSENLLKDMDINSSLQFKKELLKPEEDKETENNAKFLKLSEKSINASEEIKSGINRNQTYNSMVNDSELLENEKEKENEVKYKKFTKFKRIKPYDYLTYQLNYTGNGSLFEYLKINNFSSKIDSGMITNNNNFYQYAISITLTNEGVDKSVNVIDSVFAYLNVIRNSEINKNYYDEIQNIGNLKTKFQVQNTRLSELSSQFSSNMFDFPYKEINIADNMHYKFDKSAIKEFLSILMPENCIILLGDKNFISNENLLYKSFFAMSNLKVDNNYNTNYLDGDFDSNSVEILKNSKVKNFTFQFRPTNEFISKENKLSFCNSEVECLEEINTRKPNKILEEKRLTFYHKYDRSFLLPKVITKIALISNINMSRNLTSKEIEKTIFMMYSLKSIISKKIDKDLSDAIISGNNINVEYSYKGIIIKIDSFKDLSSLILTKIIDIISSLEKISKIDFESISEDNKEYLDMVEYQKNHLDDSLEILSKIVRKNYQPINKSIYDRKYDYQTYLSNVKDVLATFSVNLLIYGNINLEESNKLATLFKKGFIGYLDNLETNNLENYNITTIIDDYNDHYVTNIPVVFEVINSNSKYRSNLVLNVFLIGKLNDHNLIMSNLIKIIWGNIFYTKMKGYNEEIINIFANLEIIDNNIYLLFTAESNNISISHENIDLQLDKILSYIRLKLEDISSTKFNDYKASYKTELLMKDNTLNERTEKVWTDIISNIFDFDMEKNLRNLVKNVKLNEIKKFFDLIFIEKPSKISLYIYNQHVIDKIRNKQVYYYLNSKIQVITTQDLHFLEKQNDKI